MNDCAASCPAIISSVNKSYPACRFLMAKTFKTAAAFKTSLEHRLKDLAGSRRTPPDTLRLKVVMERLLARLFAQLAPSWLLKVVPRRRSLRDTYGCRHIDGASPQPKRCRFRL